MLCLPKHTCTWNCSEHILAAALTSTQEIFESNNLLFQWPVWCKSIWFILQWKIYHALVTKAVPINDKLANIFSVEPEIKRSAVSWTRQWELGPHIYSTTLCCWSWSCCKFLPADIRRCTCAYIYCWRNKGSFRCGP